MYSIFSCHIHEQNPIQVSWNMTHEAIFERVYRNISVIIASHLGSSLQFHKCHAFPVFILLAGRRVSAFIAYLTGNIQHFRYFKHKNPYGGTRRILLLIGFIIWTKKKSPLMAFTNEKSIDGFYEAMIRFSMQMPPTSHRSSPASSSQTLVERFSTGRWMEWEPFRGFP